MLQNLNRDHPICQTFQRSIGRIIDLFIISDIPITEWKIKLRKFHVFVPIARQGGHPASPSHRALYFQDMTNPARLRSRGKKKKPDTIRESGRSSQAEQKGEGKSLIPVAEGPLAFRSDHREQSGHLMIPVTVHWSADQHHHIDDVIYRARFMALTDPASNLTPHHPGFSGAVRVSLSVSPGI